MVLPYSSSSFVQSVVHNHKVLVVDVDNHVDNSSIVGVGVDIVVVVEVLHKVMDSTEMVVVDNTVVVVDDDIGVVVENLVGNRVVEEKVQLVAMSMQLELDAELFHLIDMNNQPCVQ